MSDTDYAAVSAAKTAQLLDLMDDEWLEDCLSDDGEFST